MTHIKGQTDAESRMNRNVKIDTLVLSHKNKELIIVLKKVSRNFIGVGKNE